MYISTKQVISNNLNQSQSILLIKMSRQSMIINVDEWNTASNRYGDVKINNIQGKSINITSKQSDRAIHLTTPMMMTWGIADFVNDAGEANGKYTISLNFPMNESRTDKTDKFLQKLKDFENQIIDDAVVNSEAWFGEAQTREICKHAFFPSLKYPKNKDTKKFDMTKPPSIRPKVQFYDEVWRVEVYDTKGNLMFPSEDPNHTPIDFVTKLSNVACVIQCAGIWIGGKAWGITWKLVQCVVKQREVENIKGRCLIQLSSEELLSMDGEVVVTQVSPQPAKAPAPKAIEPISTYVQDSDDEEVVPEPQVVLPVAVKKTIKKAVSEPEPEVEAEAEAEVISPPEPPTPTVVDVPVVKKIIKKTVATPAPVAEAVVSEDSAPVVKKVLKKVIKKVPVV